MPLRDRQRAEVRELCRTGPFSRAVDLSFAHFADFGRDEALVALLAEAMTHLGATDADRRRFADLQAVHPAVHSSASSA